MRRRKIVNIVGARPQFIKMSVVSRCIREKFNQITVHTGQHYDQEMSRIFFQELGLPEPEYNLGIKSVMRGERLGRMVTAIEKVLVRAKPDVVIVYGDTDSTLAGALAAAGFSIPVAHIEAGVRSFRKWMPEEINRVLTDRLCSIFFCPTKTAVINLKNEGITKNVHNVGDVMLDTMRFYLKKAMRRSRVLSRLNICGVPYYLATIHRAENTSSREKMSKILEILGGLGKLVIFPLHPRTKKAIAEFGIPVNRQRIKFIGPVSYFDALNLEAKAKAVLTDSGGVQKEAYFLNVPCVTLREETEWIETLRNGSNRVVGLDKHKVRRALANFSAQPARSDIRLFGGGKACERIVSTLTQFFKDK